MKCWLSWPLSVTPNMNLGYGHESEVQPTKLQSRKGWQRDRVAKVNCHPGNILVGCREHSIFSLTKWALSYSSSLQFSWLRWPSHLYGVRQSPTSAPSLRTQPPSPAWESLRLSQVGQENELQGCDGLSIIEQFLYELESCHRHSSNKGFTLLARQQIGWPDSLRMWV